MSIQNFITFNNGQKVPVLGLGTWNSEPRKVKQAVKDAIDIGYRHIDCAYIYGNEKEVGQGIKAKIDEGVVTREDLFVTSKLWNTFHRKDLVLPALTESLTNLGLDYLDLYLIHWPFGYKEGEDLKPVKNGKIRFSNVDYVEPWKEMEKLVTANLVRSIGVSNFNSEQLERLLTKARIRPVTNQIEVHPYLNQQKLSDFCRTRSVAITAYSPLGSPARPGVTEDDKNVLEDPMIINSAKTRLKTPAQMCIRWNLQLGNIVIPKSVNKTRMSENYDALNFILSNEDMTGFNMLDDDYRVCAMEEAYGHKYHPFENIEF